MLNIIKQKDTFYFESIEKYKDYRKDLTFEENERLSPINIVHDYDIIGNDNTNFIDMKKFNIIYYISDLHLDYKIAQKFPHRTTKEKIRKYITSIIEKIINELGGKLFFNNYLIIAGDVSHSFEVSKMFYEELAKHECIQKENIIVILGNHELWENDDINISINKYKKMFESLNITYLDNELLYVKGLGLIGKFYKLSEEEINNYTEEELRNICIDSKLTILGGIGFSGLNNKYNANYGLYRNAVKSIAEDRILSSRFENIYLKLKNCLSDKELIILTHNPKSDWSNDRYNSKWIYINGHTHRNEYYKDDERIVYSDNQIGYYNDNITLKHFVCTRKYDIFQYYEDGIYEISVQEYVDFIYGMGIKMEYSRKDGIINMLKRDGIYCFILKVNEKLYLLNGGTRIKLNIHDLSYYYENMTYYSNKIKETTKKYIDYMKDISNYIKSIGGHGTIHGCIVDIDFYNHVYVNPYDGKIIPYYATSIIDKYVYQDFEKMLINHCPNVYVTYKKMKEEKNNIIVKENNSIKLFDFEYYQDTFIYRESRIIKNLQYLINDNIIRMWNDNLISNKETFETILIEDKK